MIQRLIYWLKLKRAQLLGTPIISVDMANSCGDYTVYCKVWHYKGSTVVENWWIDTETKGLK